MGFPKGGRLHAREHQVERYSQFFCTVTVRKAGRVRYDGIRNKWAPFLGMLFSIFGRVVHTITSFNTRPPAAMHNFRYLCLTLGYVSCLQRLLAWQEPWVLHHYEDLVVFVE